VLEKPINALLSTSLTALLPLQLCEIKYSKIKVFFQEQEVTHPNVPHSEFTNEDHISTCFLDMAHPIAT